MIVGNHGGETSTTGDGEWKKELIGKMAADGGVGTDEVAEMFSRTLADSFRSDVGFAKRAGDFRDVFKHRFAKAANTTPRAGFAGFHGGVIAGKLFHRCLEDAPGDVKRKIAGGNADVGELKFAAIVEMQFG